jgi:hypothetical protein
MKCNIGKTDRILRGIVGIVIIAIGLYFQNWWGAIGVVPLATSFLRFCPLYVPLKITTEKKEENNNK